MFLNPVLELRIGYADDEGLAGHVAVPCGAQPRLVTLGVDLSFEMVQDFVPSIHGVDLRMEDSV